MHIEVKKFMIIYISLSHSINMMNYNIIKRILLNTVVGAVLCNYCIYAQECNDGFTYFDTIPENVTNINNDSNCFSVDDIAVLAETA